MTIELCFLGQTYIGQLEAVSDIKHHLAILPPRHRAYFCPVCGEVWGRRVYHDERVTKWMAVERRCPTHGGGFFTTIHEATHIRDVNLLAHEVLHGSNVFKGVDDD